MLLSCYKLNFQFLSSNFTVLTVLPACLQAEVKKDGGREKTEGQDRKERKNFLRVKLKKKKKKKKKSQTGKSQCTVPTNNSSYTALCLKSEPIV